MINVFKEDNIVTILTDKQPVHINLDKVTMKELYDILQPLSNDVKECALHLLNLDNIVFISKDPKEVLRKQFPLHFHILDCVNEM